MVCGGGLISPPLKFGAKAEKRWVAKGFSSTKSLQLLELGLKHTPQLSMSFPGMAPGMGAGQSGLSEEQMKEQQMIKYVRCRRHSILS